MKRFDHNMVSDDVVVRLRHSQSRMRPSPPENPRHAGRFWACETATAKQLTALKSYSLAVANGHIPLFDGEMTLGAVFAELIGVPKLQDEPEGYEVSRFWTQVVHHWLENEDKAAAVRAFLIGALEIWKAAEERILCEDWNQLESAFCDSEAA